MMDIKLLASGQYGGPYTKTDSKLEVQGQGN